MQCLGCFGGRRVASGRCFRCKGTGIEPQIEQDYVTAINVRLMVKRLHEV